MGSIDWLREGPRCPRTPRVGPCRDPAGTCKNAVKINGAFKTPGRQAPYTIMNVCTPDHRRMAPLCYDFGQ